MACFYPTYKNQIYTIILSKYTVKTHNLNCQKEVESDINDFRRITEVQRLKTCQLKQPVDWHVVETIHVKMGKMNLRTCDGKNVEIRSSC